LVNYSTEVKPGEWVFIRGSTVALPLVREVVRAVVKAGANHNLILDDDDVAQIVLSSANDDQLQWVSPIENITVEQADVFISLNAPSNTRVLSGVDPTRQRLRQAARREIFIKYMQRSAEGKLRWVTTNFPCQSLAQEADMSLGEYEDFVYSATFADQPDPIEAWQKVSTEQQRLVEWLKGKRQVTVRGPNSDLHLSIEERPFINCDGKYNMPDGEIFTGPVEDSVEGWVRFTYPAIHQGREVDGVELEFKEGRVVNAHAKKNEEFLISQLDTDPGARYLGEFAIGTNFQIDRFTHNILLDEKIGGSFHMAVGAGYPETGSKNKSAVHWDMICDMRQDSEILVDGEAIYRNGVFLT
jgi:aminopeptidase